MFDTPTRHSYFAVAKDESHHTRHFLEIAEPGVYVFSTKSDDGSRILLGGQCVPDNDGIHDTKPTCSRVMFHR